MKVKKEFLKKVIKNRIVCTKNYLYKRFDYGAANENGEFYSFSIIKRIDINNGDTTRYLDKENWETIARTEDGKNFLKA